MQFRNALFIVSAIILSAGFSGCSDARKSLGWDKNAPDEFRVVSRAPLAVPPDFALRPPEPGAQPTNEISTRTQAQSAVFGKRHSSTPTGASTGDRTPGEVALLKAAGADGVVPDIRSIVNSETSAMSLADKPFTDKLIFWKKPTPETGPIVNAGEEANRLRENQALGQPITEGETPVIRRKKKALLEGIF